MTRTKNDAQREKHPVDIKVGKLIRARRRILNMTQEDLAEKSGVKFQQIQKYELGDNRVSASRLKMIADALEVHPAFFFDENFEKHTGITVHIEALGGGSNPIGRMVQVFAHLDAKVQEQLIELTKSLGSNIRQCD